MKKTEMIKSMSILKVSKLKGIPEYDNEFYDIWYLYFQEYSIIDFNKAIYFYIQESRFFPTISELLKYIEKPDGLPEPELLKPYLNKGKNYPEFLKILLNDMGKNYEQKGRLEYILADDFRFRDFQKAYRIELEKYRREQKELKVLQIINKQKLLK